MTTYYTLQNTACVKTLAYDPVQLTFDFSDATKNYTVNGEKYAYYKVNEKEFLVANDKKNINVITANAAGFKIQDKELDAAQIDNAKTIALPDGALVSNVTENLFKLTAKNSAASFGDADKKVLLTEDGAGDFTIGGCVYQVTDDNDGIQLVRNGDDWTVENLDTLLHVG